MVIYDYSTDCHAVPDYFYQTRAAEIARAPDTETVRHRDRFASGSIGCGWLEVVCVLTLWSDLSESHFCARWQSY